MPSPGWHRLQAAIEGRVVPDPEPTTFNARFHHVRPRAAVRCASPADVAATLSYLRQHDLPFAVRSGGHCFAGHSSSAGVVLDVTPMDHVVPDGDLVTVGAGARLGAVYDRLQLDDRALPAGTCPTVGIAGLAWAVASASSVAATDSRPTGWSRPRSCWPTAASSPATRAMRRTSSGRCGEPAPPASAW